MTYYLEQPDKPWWVSPASERKDPTEHVFFFLFGGVAFTGGGCVLVGLPLDIIFNLKGGTSLLVSLLASAVSMLFVYVMSFFIGPKMYPARAFDTKVQRMYAQDFDEFSSDKKEHMRPALDAILAFDEAEDSYEDLTCARHIWGCTSEAYDKLQAQLKTSAMSPFIEDARRNLDEIQHSITRAKEIM